MILICPTPPQAAGAQVQPYFAETQFQPAFERRDATQLCGGLGLPLKVSAQPAGALLLL